jgi:transcriptional regulator with XRE-family HTH domain
MGRADLDPAELRALGAAVRELRARRGLSQEELGYRGELHRNYVGGIERGELNITFRVLLKLEQGLAMPLSELIGIYERNRIAQADVIPPGRPAREHGRTSGSQEAPGPPSVDEAGAAGSGSADGRPSPLGVSSAEPPARPIGLATRDGEFR